MGLVRTIIGPKSKYKKDIPYTYEAKIKIIEGEDECISYLADKICSLVEYLEKNSFDAKDVEIYEIFNQEETKLNIKFCTSNEGEWLTCQELCESLREYYPGRIDENGCIFEDRASTVTGP